jgi:hypothetical protein
LLLPTLIIWLYGLFFFLLIEIFLWCCSFLFLFTCYINTMNDFILSFLMMCSRKGHESSNLPYLYFCLK